MSHFAFWALLSFHMKPNLFLRFPDMRNEVVAQSDVFMQKAKDIAWASEAMKERHGFVCLLPTTYTPILGPSSGTYAWYSVYYILRFSSGFGLVSWSRNQFM